MNNVSDKLLKILRDRDYRVANAPGIATQWIASKCYAHSDKNTSLVDLLFISRLNPLQNPRAMNQVVDSLNLHCFRFMSEIENEFDTLKTNNGNSNSRILQTLKILIPNLETREISLPMYKAVIHRIDKNVITFHVNPIILVDDVSANFLDLDNSSKEWLVAFGNHNRYKMYVVPAKRFGRFLDAKTESAKKTVEELSDGKVKSLTRPLSISQKILTILGCIWGLIALDIAFNTNIIPLNLYWSSLLIASLAILMGTIASIIIGGIKFRKVHKDRFVLHAESYQTLQPSIISKIDPEYSKSNRQFPSGLPISPITGNLNFCLRDFEMILREAKLDFENMDFTSFFAKAQSALYSAMKAKYFELTNRSPGTLSFSQLVNILRKNELALPSDKEIGKWTKTVELALLDKDGSSFRIAKDYLLYLSRFISSLKPFKNRDISPRFAHSKAKEESQRKDLASNIPTQR